MRLGLANVDHGFSEEQPSRSSRASTQLIYVARNLENFYFEEAKDQFGKAPTIPLARAVTSPSLLLRERYQTALKSQKHTSPVYRPEKSVRGRGLREEEIHFIEQAIRRRLSDSSLGPSTPQISPDFCPPADRPQIKVKASAQSISIIIPEGIKLPIVATIESAGEFDFETQMSTSNVGEQSEPSSITGDDPSARGMSRRQKTSSEQTTTGAIQASENQEIRAGWALPFLARVSKGRLNVSEASVSAPQSTDFSAAGQVFLPPHERAPEEVSDPLHDHLKAAEVEETDSLDASEPVKEPREGSDLQDRTEPEIDPLEPVVTAPLQVESASEPEEADPGSVEPAPTSSPKSANAVDPVADSAPQVEDPQAFSIPEIRIHRPSGTITSEIVGISGVNDASMAPIPEQTATEQSPAGTPLNAVSNPAGAVSPPTTLPTDPTAVTNVAPINTVVSAVPIPVPGLPLAGKIPRRKRVMRKARRVIVRKRLLSLILGRDLANVVHPQLNTTGESVPNVPLPLDGPSDLMSGYERREEHRKAVRQRHLEQKIASARIHAEAEEIQRCQSCRGLKRTSYSRKYHRSQLQRDRPDMGVLERHAMSRARVARSKCQCKRRASGAGDEGERLYTLPTDAQHLRGPGADEGLLAVVIGDSAR
ncbi:hypothetical protein AYO21_07377 [Fonsecaea monophora]|uniref:Uncharacterized protein n=1 Tax=Fonsecaea monophora TaxID=254056 RepID=A0A177F239_9EURO|nr:hypothetical protein AYO21_07377 [Fonsecaea monophora]OAG38394.1 hypothetical protein AYO21_07377 [Fonsecaea monophora]